MSALRIIAPLLAAAVLLAPFIASVPGSGTPPSVPAPPDDPTTLAHGVLPSVPAPRENPTTEPKRVLGKILFWDEQLSSNDTVACGTCHRPEHGGADPRAGRHPGTDPGTIDDVIGSPGIVRLGPDLTPLEHDLFGFEVQVSARAAPSNFGALTAPELFWDGRASGTFRDPQTGAVLIQRGGALESQAVIALENEAEMAHAGRGADWLPRKLERVSPLALATDWPPDVAAALERRPTYSTLFEAAFGDSRITLARIAFALAAYQRTLIADATPWDRHVAGDASALTPAQVAGWRAFQAERCVACHTPPLFTNHGFFNIGVRRAALDPGRAGVTGGQEDAGDMKVPSLRNVGLRPRYMHTGEFDRLGAAVGFYVASRPSPERDDLPGGIAYSFNLGAATVTEIIDFLANGLTDPRVRDARFPFDRPTLRSERHE